MGCACSVEVDLDNGDQVTTTWQKIKKARVAHKCDECHRVITIGETYEHYTGICDGSFFKNKTCSDCLSIRDAFFTDGYYFGQVMGDFREFISKENRQVSEECLSTLTLRAREMACELIQGIWLELHLNFPTSPAFRVDKMIKKLGYRKDWMAEICVEIDRVDKAVWDAIETARAKAINSEREQWKRK